MGNRFNTRIEGTPSEHSMGPVPIKRYDKFRLIRRIETTVRPVSFFKHYREVENRYLAFTSAIEDDRMRTNKLNKISTRVEENERSYRGFNFFDPEDEDPFPSLGSGDFNIGGFQNKDLRRRLAHKNTGRVSRLMKRLRTHGLIKRIGKTYKYHLTALGLQLKHLYLIPQLSMIYAG